MLESRELATAGVKRELGTTTLSQRGGDGSDVGPASDALVRDRMQARQRRSHVNLVPGLIRAPWSQSSVVMRALPAGCTSKTSTVPPPVAITREPSAESTSPGAPVPRSFTLGLKSLISAPLSSVQAPGRGSSPRIKQSI